jgi:hypothetical protein
MEPNPTFVKFSTWLYLRKKAALDFFKIVQRAKIRRIWSPWMTRSAAERR